MTPRCEGRYPVPATSPARDEPFEVTYRCGLHQGHDGPHKAFGDQADPQSPAAQERTEATMSETKPAFEMLDARDKSFMLEEQMSDTLIGLCGIDCNKPDTWPLKDVTFDSYDTSFEFKGCRNDWAPTQAQLEACFALGFARCWICYEDNTEIYASPGHMGERHKYPVDRPPRRNNRKDALLLKADLLRVTQERDEARRFGEEAAARYNELLATCAENTAVTCAFCGVVYPPGTPRHGDGQLADHIRTCEQHPLRAAEARVAALEAELADLRGHRSGL